MKLIRFGEPGKERPGLILTDGRRVDVSVFGADYDETFFGSCGLERLGRALARSRRSSVERGNGQTGGGDSPRPVAGSWAPACPQRTRTNPCRGRAAPGGWKGDAQGAAEAARPEKGFVVVRTEHGDVHAPAIGQ